MVRTHILGQPLKVECLAEEDEFEKSIDHKVIRD